MWAFQTCRPPCSKRCQPLMKVFKCMLLDSQGCAVNQIDMLISMTQGPPHAYRTGRRLKQQVMGPHSSSFSMLSAPSFLSFSGALQASTFFCASSSSFS